ncbi:branched-chain amino acid aminotransferase [Eilatimonas milleporae]|uniref:Branched-chain-amino-acid aminotransferase n=1 Tax=Eilatimonas milleporae TaxID=911205 RepID=A0A3M0CSC8_9PROT|nr:branched-chain amino acid aminotransferase [Eilatimonas milleporae]RMB11765.1 branched chain amino acid aminotransferase [Eilatimonas milleporae]
MASAAFDQREGWIWMDGQIIPWAEATLHILSHAMHYGSAVFEGQRAYNGRIFKLEEHTERLFASAAALDMDVPFSREDINSACNTLLQKNGLKDAYCRPILWRGSETMGVSATGTRIHGAIAVWEWPSYFTPEQRLKGLKLDISKWRRPGPDMAPVHAKAAGLYMICTLSRHVAEAKGCDDALMYDYRGQIAEATGANIFFVSDGRLHTPVADCFLDGITRKSVIDLAGQHGIEVMERAIMPDEMPHFEEAFLTGTAAEVSPVAEIGPHSFRPGAITKTLMEEYDRLVRRSD